jgi:hypothetical protein
MNVVTYPCFLNNMRRAERYRLCCTWHCVLNSVVCAQHCSLCRTYHCVPNIILYVEHYTVCWTLQFVPNVSLCSEHSLYRTLYVVLNILLCAEHYSLCRTYHCVLNIIHCTEHYTLCWTYTFYWILQFVLKASVCADGWNSSWILQLSLLFLRLSMLRPVERRGRNSCKGSVTPSFRNGAQFSVTNPGSCEGGWVATDILLQTVVCGFYLECVLWMIETCLRFRHTIKPLLDMPL